MTIKEIFQQLGFSEKEAAIYNVLLEHGPSPASFIAAKASLKRSYAYNVIDELITKGLIEEVKKPGDKTQFQLTAPENLRNLIQSKTETIVQSSKILEDMLPAIKSKFNLVTLKPPVLHFEGLDGLKNVYDDILKTKADLLIFASKLDREHREFTELIDKQIKKQYQAKIRTKALIRHEINTKEIKSALKLGVEQRGLKNWGLDSQIIVYGNKIAITSFKGSFISTLIEDQSIANSFRMIFSFLWTQAMPFPL